VYCAGDSPPGKPALGIALLLAVVLKAGVPKKAQPSEGGKYPLPGERGNNFPPKRNTHKKMPRRMLIFAKKSSSQGLEQKKRH
jgi:hypothetical protein